MQKHLATYYFTMASTDFFLRYVQFVHSPSAVDRAGDIPAIGRCGHRQISTVTRFQDHPSGLLHWSRGPCSRMAGGSLLTGAILKARSAGGVSGSFGRSVLKAKLLVAGLSFVSSPALLHKLQVISKIPKIHKTRLSPIDALTSFRNLRLIIH